MGDINCFKSYNDTLGHNAGDSVLVKVAGVLDKHMGRSGIVCRYGGDEFVVLLSNHSEEAVIGQIRSVQDELMKEEIEMAFGYVFVSDPKQDLGLMIRQADVNMYVNKERMKHKNQ
ncbi:Diguanylate cyclase DosC [bioreactor metagenome]|uniref:Diguanylate cyclase DosC n=1 Tax=bioreactor metagenome TaxID=1076179 RepID=A0A645CWT8_9ZZZZ